MSVYRGDDPAKLDAALRSVLDQELGAGVESRIYLGVDGPVPDSIEAVIRCHASRLHQVHRSERNQGLARMLNALIGCLSDEQYVFRMDADDVSMPGRYAAQLHCMSHRSDVDILGTAIIEHDEATRTERLVRFAKSPEDALANIHRRVPVAHPTVCFRRHALDQAGGYPIKGTNEDIALWFHCLKLGLRFDNLEEPLLRFTISSRFWQRRGWAKSWGEFRCYVSGIRELFGPWNWRYIAPIARLTVRLAPTFIVKRLYASRLRA